MTRPVWRSSVNSNHLAWLRWLSAVACLCIVLTSRAQSSEPRVVVVSNGHEELARKLRAQAASQGLAPTDANGGAALDDDQLAVQHAAVATLRVASPARVRVFVRGSAEHAAYAVELELQAGEADTFPLRVIEHLRARLVELRLMVPVDSGSMDAPAPPPPADAERSPALPRLAAQPAPTPVASPATPVASPAIPEDARAAKQPKALRPALWLAAGPASTLGSGGVGPLPQIALGLRVEPSSSWSVSASALLPIEENEINAGAGSADVSASLFLLDVERRLTLGRGWHLEFGPGAGIAALAMAGETQTPRVAHAESALLGIYYLHTGLGWTAASWLRFSTSLRGGVTAPRSVLRFDGQEVATWGRSFGTLSLTAELGWQLSSARGEP